MPSLLSPLLAQTRVVAPESTCWFQFLGATFADAPDGVSDVSYVGGEMRPAAWHGTDVFASGQGRLLPLALFLGFFLVWFGRLCVAYRGVKGGGSFVSGVARERKRCGFCFVWQNVYRFQARICRDCSVGISL